MDKRKTEHKCQYCGICCYKLSPTLTPEDLNREPRLRAVMIARAQVRNPVMKRYMREKNRMWGLGKAYRGAPCPFLRDNLCNIHATRPSDCRVYPGTSLCWREREAVRKKRKKKLRQRSE